MNVQKIVDFLIAHNVELIQWLVAAILLIVVGYLVTTLFRKPEATTSAGSESTEDIRQALKEVLEATKAAAPVVAVAPEAAASSHTPAADSGSAEALAAANAEAEKLQAQVEALRKELEDQKQAVSAGDPAKDEKIAELESKLSEYEILEDDIADLSLYKEENEKLKKQLAELNAGIAETPAESTEAPAAADAPAAEADAAPTAEAESLVEEFAAALETPTEAEEAPPAEDVAAAVKADLDKPNFEEPSTDQQDFMAEFEDAMKNTAPAAGAEDKSASLPNPREELASQSADDLMAEFEKSISEEASAGVAESLTDLNTEKMLEEMAELATVPTSDNDASALEEAIDTDKMADEATKLKG